jgi:hypothetical protein
MANTPKKKLELGSGRQVLEETVRDNKRWLDDTQHLGHS